MDWGEIQINLTAVENLVDHYAMEEGAAWAATKFLANDLQAFYDRYLTLPLSPIGQNVLDSQITDLEGGTALISELKPFFANLADESIATHGMGETVTSYDCVINWLLGHVSSANDMILSFNESDRFLRNARSTDVGRILNETNEHYDQVRNRLLRIGEMLVKEKQLLLWLCSIHLKGMKVTVKQRHVEQQPECSICLADFILAETVCNTPCNHLFHFQCIVPWLKKEKTCPLCRTNCLLITLGEK